MAPLSPKGIKRMADTIITPYTRDCHTSKPASNAGRMIKKPAPSTEPSREAKPSRMIMVMNWMDRKKLNSCGSRNPTRKALKAPAKPVYRALTAKARVL